MPRTRVDERPWECHVIQPPSNLLARTTGALSRRQLTGSETLEVADNEGGRELALGGHKQRSVLTILLLRPNEVVSQDRLVEELWPGGPPASAAPSSRSTTRSDWLSGPPTGFANINGRTRGRL